MSKKAQKQKVNKLSKKASKRHRGRICIYSENIFQYFHFVTAGLSDLYGDGRVRFPKVDGLSGFGIELTIKGHPQGFGTFL